MALFDSIDYLADLGFSGFDDVAPLMMHSIEDMLTPPTSPQASAPFFAPIDAKPLDDVTFEELSRTLSGARTPLPDTLTPPASPRASFAGTSFVELKADPVYHEVMSMLSDLSDDSSAAPSPVPSPAPISAAAAPSGTRSRKRKQSYATMFDEEDDSASDSAVAVPAPRVKRVRPNKSKAPAAAAPVEQAEAADDGKAGRRVLDKEILSKRDSHNISERQRRKELKHSFEHLRRAIPVLADNPRVHTASILQSAIDYVARLQQEEAELEAQMEALRAENARLSRA